MLLKFEPKLRISVLVQFISVIVTLIMITGIMLKSYPLISN